MIYKVYIAYVLVPLGAWGSFDPVKCLYDKNNFGSTCLQSLLVHFWSSKVLNQGLFHVNFDTWRFCFDPLCSPLKMMLMHMITLLIHFKSIRIRNMVTWNCLLHRFCRKKFPPLFVEMQVISNRRLICIFFDGFLFVRPLIWLIEFWTL